MRSHGLNARQLASLRRSLAPDGRNVERVALFGSRATGRWRPSSDIDLVLFGAPTPQEVSRMRASLDDGDLPVTVDLVVYADVHEPALKAHIDRVAVVLFTREELRRSEQRGSDRQSAGGAPS